MAEQLVQLDDGSRVRRQPKTDAGTRTITVSAAVAAMLADHLDRFVPPEPGRARCSRTAPASPLSHSSFQTHHFRKAQLAAGVSCRFHDLRHTSVALAIADGAHPKAIQVRMGHSSITVTLDRYGHLFPELDEAIATAFDARFRAMQVAAAEAASGKNGT